jgi:hypothetical protein
MRKEEEREKKQVVVDDGETTGLMNKGREKRRDEMFRAGQVSLGNFLGRAARVSRLGPLVLTSKMAYDPKLRLWGWGGWWRHWMA